MQNPNHSAWLRLLYARVPAKKLVRALKQVSSLEAVLCLSDSRLLALGFTENQVQILQYPDQSRLQKDLAWLADNPDCQCISFLEERYPLLLLEIANPPIALFVKGDVSLLKQPQLAIVGSRMASRQGKAIAFDFAKAFAAAGLVVTSGMALGIDAASHHGALLTGQTIAVLGTGLAVTYPRQHCSLSAEIADCGALVSEFAPMDGPNARHFPLRNRIISGMSLGVLVVEAAKRSGSLITAKLALEQGRDVFAMPGSIYNSMAKGCHDLIRAGAKIVDSIQGVMEELPPPFGQDFVLSAPVSKKSSQKSAHNLDKAHQSLLDCMDDSPISVEELINLSGLASDCLSTMLLSLESWGLLERVAGGYRKIMGQTSSVR